MMNFIHNIKYVLNTSIFNLTYLMNSAIRKKNKKIIGFANTHFNGNIKCLYEEMSKHPDFKIYFVTDVKSGLKDLRDNGIEAYYCRDLKKIPLFVKTNVWVTSHGTFCIPSHYLYKLFKKRRSKWVDTWHGMASLKKIQRPKMLKDYDIGFVSSEFYVRYYTSQEKKISNKLKITGFPRIDILLDNSLEKQKILEDLGIDKNRKNVLYAPSWGTPAADEGKDKTLFPFENDEIVLNELNDISTNYNCNILIRTHPNWERDNIVYCSNLINKIKKINNIYYLPFNKFPVTEPILYISDILITDHSSISDDFILLKRPIIFMDTGIPQDLLVFPFKDRAGIVAKNKDELMSALRYCLINPSEYYRDLGEKQDAFVKKIYKYPDGKSSKRCVEEIMKLIK